MDDLLDLAKVEAGKIDVRPIELRGRRSVRRAARDAAAAARQRSRGVCVFDEPTDLPRLYTDEAKVSQILRNFISNALKFTERGEMRVTRDHDAVDGTVDVLGDRYRHRHRARRSGANLRRIRAGREPACSASVKGTGLGLPLCRKLATLLGGTIGVRSEPGLGSTFSQRCRAPV